MNEIHRMELNGHLIAYGKNDEIYQAKCLRCTDTQTFELDSLTSDELILLQFYSFHDFSEHYCRNANINVGHEIEQSIKEKYIGMMNSKENRHKLSKDLSIIFPDTVSTDTVVDEYVNIR